jgi:hypothetical protein
MRDCSGSKLDWFLEKNATKTKANIHVHPKYKGVKMRDTIFFIIGLIIVFAMGFAGIYDYYLFMTNQTTFSTVVREYATINANRPCLFVFIGTVIGLIVGLILGFILGHLFWT